MTDSSHAPVAAEEAAPLIINPQTLVVSPFAGTALPLGGILDPLSPLEQLPRTIARQEIEALGQSLGPGAVITVPFNAANFTAQAGTWTVDAAHVLFNGYVQFGHMVAWTVQLLVGTILSATPTSLGIALPIGPCLYPSAAVLALASTNWGTVGMTNGGYTVANLWWTSFSAGVAWPTGAQPTMQFTLVYLV